MELSGCGARPLARHRSAAATASLPTATLSAPARKYAAATSSALRAAPLAASV
jgi:hypothetical protein